MKFFSSTAITALLLSVVKGDDSFQAEDAHRNVAKAINSFSTSLYKVLSEESSGNMVVSPFSVETVLAMVLVGLRGNTAQHVSSALHLPDSRERTEHGFKALFASLQASENVTLEMANKIYVQEGFKIKDEFRQSAENNFQSSVELVDFSNKTEAVRNIINQWVEQKTNQKIQELIVEGNLNPNTVVMLLNAMYFKGQWSTEFNKTLTSKENFHLDTKSTRQVQMMHHMNRFRYGKFDDLQATVLKLPYQGEKISMLIILPMEVEGLKNLESKITSLNITYILNSLLYKQVIVSLPRFKIESTLALEDSLQKLGLSEILRPGADFSGMTDDAIYVNKVLQKAFIEVNEEGTEAASATAAGGIAISLPPPPKVFKADHPFMFMIVDEPADTILFMGRVLQPQ
ncbi:leukocyte elastase inhibitor [Anabrus simplex]|uniref:leukocyte elastase inhibitor n=1 Tax=Anabrus simplex TaxID=316456 RepID=UPI0035A3C1D4